MPIDFPNSPTTGDVYTYQSRSWVWSGTVWDTLEAVVVPNTFAIQLNEQTISENYNINSGYNGVSAGPITIASGITVTVASGSSWSIV
jgi:hypothetical protein